MGWRGTGPEGQSSAFISRQCEKGVGTFLKPLSPSLISKRIPPDDDFTGLRPGREIDR